MEEELGTCSICGKPILVNQWVVTDQDGADCHAACAGLAAPPSPEALQQRRRAKDKQVAKRRRRRKQRR